MEAKTFLSQIQKIDVMIQNKLYEIQMLKHKAFDISASAEEVKVQKSGNHSKMECIVVSYIDMENEFAAKIKMLQEQKNKIIDVIEQLPVLEYDFLHKVYVSGMSIYEVAEKYDRTYSWATTIHARALKMVQKILDEREMK